MGCPQVVRVGNNTSATLILNTGAPRGCMPSLLLYSLFTHNCVAKHDSNNITKFADNTTVVSLITYNNETAYREVRDLAVWCQDNNLSPNMSKKKEPIVDFDGSEVTRGESFKFLGVHNKLMVQAHQDNCEETTTPFPPQETEKIWHGSLDPQK